MSFDELFILPNEEPTQSGGIEPFTILKYTGSDTLTKRPELELIKPYILTNKESPTTSVTTLEGYEAATGLSEGDIMAVSGDAFLQILETQGLGGGLEKHLFFNPNNAAVIPIEEVLGEQVIFLTIFHQLYFLASINKLGLPTLNAPINERFDALKALLKDEQFATSVFGVPHKKMSEYFTEIQTTYVGPDDVREKSFVDMCEMILGEPTDILKYFKDAVAHVKTPAGNTGTAYTGTNTRRGFDSISLESGSQNGNNNNEGNKPPVPGAPTTGGPKTGIGAVSGVVAGVPKSEGNASGVATGAPKGEGNASGVATGAPKGEGNASGVVAGVPKGEGNANNNASMRTLGSLKEGAEGKEGEDDGEGKEGEDDNAGSASGSSSSGNPRSVAASTAASTEEGKDAEEDAGFGAVNARLTAVVPPAQKVKPPVIPVTNTTRSARRSRAAILAARKQGANTLAAAIGREENENENEQVKPKRVSRKKGKKGKRDELSKRASTNNTTAAVYGHELENEVVSNNESEDGYNTTAAVAPSRGKAKGVGFRSTSSVINSSGLESIVPTSKKGKK